ncbi:MAG: dual specificity protein phosphatase family protein [Blastocatellia bacterium]|nr:dual specificity protein phosphatase family protein [Blastocatellia bacterium]
MSNTPIDDSYWLVPGRLLAGEYPGAETKEEARRKLRSFLNAGVDFFLDLTEEDEGLEPYAPLLQEEAMARDHEVIYRRLPIPDMDAPTTERMSEIQQTIAAALEEGRTVYVHCWGGVGRTGTVIGCYLVEHEVSFLEALAEIRRRRRGTKDGWKKSPETPAQEDFVKRWRSFTSQGQSRKLSRGSIKAA